MEHRKRPSGLRIWFEAVRFPSFTATLLPVAMGGAFAVADRAFDGILFLLSWVTATLVHAGTNLIYEYQDHIRGTDIRQSFATGGVIQKGWLTPFQVRNGGFACYALALLVGAFLVKNSGMFLLFAGLTGMALGYLYSAGPYPLASRRWGEMTVFFLSGPLTVVCAYYVQVHLIRAGVVLGSVPIGLMTTAMVYAKNLRDREEDQNAGRETLATLAGRQWDKQLYILWIGGAYLVQFLLVVFGVLPWLSLVAWMTLPLAWRAAVRVRLYDSPLQLNLVLGLTVLLHLLYGTLLVLSMYIATLLW
jgi:1,4-dihydroxy-2-naphthoate octaprenyltransferase